MLENNPKNAGNWFNLFLRNIKSTWNELNDFALGIETSTDHSQNEINIQSEYKDNHEYDTPGYSNLRKILQLLRPGSNDVFFDIGAGKGRMICLAAQWQIKKCVGIEFLDSYCKIAEQNSLRLRGKKTVIDIRCCDAAAADLSEGTIYFLFNPFGRHTMEQVLSNIRKSLEDNPRKIRIAYCYPVCENLFEESDWLTKYLDYNYHLIGSKKKLLVTFWTNEEPRRASIQNNRSFSAIQSHPITAH